MTSFSFLKNGVFWSNALTVAYFFFGAVAKVYPNSEVVGVLVLGLNFVLTAYFHKQTLQAALAAK